MEKQGTSDRLGAVQGEVPQQSEGSRKIEALKNSVIVKALAALLFALVPVISAWSSNRQTAVVKDKAEAGYQDVDKWVKHFEANDNLLRARIAKLEEELAEVRRRAKLSVGRQRAETVARASAPQAAPAPALVLPPPPPPLAPNLDKALEQQQVKAAAAPAAAPAPAQ
jgi:hypothetical protein